MEDFTLGLIITVAIIAICGPALWRFFQSLWLHSTIRQEWQKFRSEKRRIASERLRKEWKHYRSEKRRLESERVRK